MGIGDDVPAGLTQLGRRAVARRSGLAAADLSRFDAIMTGTRAMPSGRPETYNRRLLDYGRAAATSRLQRGARAQSVRTLSGELSRDAEKSGGRFSVEILAPSGPCFAADEISADFDNWVEQRGSKFWSTSLAYLR
jgi:hypothetical protein